MKTILKIAVVVSTLVLMLMIDIPNLPVQLVPDADAIFGVRRRAFRRGVIIGESAAASQQHAAAAPAPAAAPAAAPAPAAPSPPPAASGQPLPLGAVVPALPGGCVSTPVGGVEYYKCGVNYYRAVFQGNKLVYVTAKP
jgi:hypothetical protein